MDQYNYWKPKVGGGCPTCLDEDIPPHVAPCNNCIFRDMKTPKTEGNEMDPECEGPPCLACGRPIASPLFSYCPWCGEELD